MGEKDQESSYGGGGRGEREQLGGGKWEVG
jgi:hypothetical protein